MIVNHGSGSGSGSDEYDSPMFTTGSTLRLALAGLLVTTILLGVDCEASLDEPSPCDLTFNLLRNLRIDEVSSPTPVLAGSVLGVRGEAFVTDEGCVTHDVMLRGVFDGVQRDVPLRSEVLSPNEISAVITPAAAEIMGSSASINAELRVRYQIVNGGGAFEASLPVSLSLAEAVVPRATSIGVTEVYLNDAVMVSGEGFIGGDEGITEIILDGTFTPTGGSSRRVAGQRVPAEIVDPTVRTRTEFHWSPFIGGFSAGRFTGTLTPENIHAGGFRVTGDPLTVDLPQQETVLFDFADDEFSLGQIVAINGRGFIGREGTSEGTTAIRLEGCFTPYDGREECSRIFDLVGEWIDGTRINYIVTVNSEGQYLRSVDFDVHRGIFHGRATPRLISGSETHEGIGVDLTLTLGPVRQIAWVRFLSGFSDSLELFGLGAVEDELKRRVIERIQQIYHPPDQPENWSNVEFRAEEPEDFYPGGYAILDIGGPDPNNLGLFGYDNTPGKDVGNLRLHDHVGGENALGALDGYGYGGVFVESILFFSSHPPGERPPAAPPADPRFDEVFDSLRFEEVVAGEYPTGAPPVRIAEIEQALWVLSSMIADTAAHEFGHSLGLAQPYGGPEEFHNTIAREGCLMDSGRDRPFVERARLDGNSGAIFCGDNLFYLRDLLPIE